MIDKLPDVLELGLKIVFCGTAAGNRSAAVGAYYAKSTNRFWPTLFEVGLTPRLPRPEEFREIPKFGLGLTDLAKKISGMDTDLQHEDYDIAGFVKRLAQYEPRIIAFNGKQAASKFLGRKRKGIQIGLQEQKVGGSLLYVLSSTSGAASGYWDIRAWRELAAAAHE